MARLEYGDRIGKHAQLRVGCSALIFDDTGKKILLTRRTDNGEWCLPGGGLDAGESAEETCMREVWEETGLTVEVVRLIGIYTTPHRVTVYQDGNRIQYISFSFEARIVAGEPGLSDEVTEVSFFAVDEIADLDLMEHHRIRIDDAVANQAAAFIR
jgi:8-oxo-dGTP pyrophosphatase MutT (NUDIX family)